MSEYLEYLPAVCLASEKQVVRFQIAVNDAVQVGLCHGLANLKSQLGDFGRSQRALLLQQGGQIPSLQILHDHERCSVIQLSDVVDAAHVLAVELGGCPGLSQEALVGDCVVVWTA